MHHHPFHYDISEQAATAIELESMSTLRSAATRKFYKIYTDEFCAFTSLNSEQIKLFSNVETKNCLIKYVLDLKAIAVESAGKPVEGRISVNSTALYVAGLKSCLDHCEKTSLPWSKIN